VGSVISCQLICYLLFFLREKVTDPTPAPPLARGGERLPHNRSTAISLPMQKENSFFLFISECQVNSAKPKLRKNERNAKGKLVFLFISEFQVNSAKPKLLKNERNANAVDLFVR
jgi:hypothetical protein